LVQELNHQLEAIKKRLARSRNATGNLAHALKAPLTLITQLANSEELQQFPHLKAKLLQHTAAIQQSIERELKRARVAGSHVAGRRTLLGPEINNLVKTLSAMYREKDLAINLKVPEDAVCTIDRQDMLEVLGNVLDNACKWAERDVAITVEQNGHTTIAIEDDGPGDPDDMEKLVHRGTRADEQVAGHGLGLSIVAEIINDYGGKLEFTNSTALGGLRVAIDIPKR
jgi:signal transduction histidine kinase